MAAELSMNGRKKIETIQKEFTNKFNYLTLLFLDENRKSLDISRSLAEVRTVKGNDVSINAGLKVNTLEARFRDNYGLMVEVAYMKDGKVMHTKDNVDKTLNEMNRWCEENGCEKFEFKKSLRGDTVLSLQEQLFNVISDQYPDAVAKKMNKDNFMDVHLPSVNSKKGTHIFFNTAKEGIKFGFYCRDEEFIKSVLEKSSNIEEYAQGVRPAGNPLFTDVDEAAEAALKFIGEMLGERSLTSQRDVNPVIAEYVSAFQENPDPICDLLDSLGTEAGKMSVYKVDLDILSNLAFADIPDADELEFVGNVDINDWDGLAEIIGEAEAEANKNEYSNDEITSSSKIIFLYSGDEYVYSFLNPGDEVDGEIDSIDNEDETKELIEFVDSLITNLDPTPININDDFPLRWESNIFIEDYDFSENFLDLDQDEERSSGKYLKSVGTAIEIEKNEDGSFEFWDGIFMIETHAWCSKLNTNQDLPSFSLINQKFRNINELKDFLVETYS